MENKAIYITQTGCNVCVSLKPKLKELFLEKYSALEWVEINATEEPELAAQHSAFTVPVFLIILEGKEYLRFSRAFSLSEVDEKMERLYGLMLGS